jgi:hypothetical protein
MPITFLPGALLRRTAVLTAGALTLLVLPLVGATDPPEKTKSVFCPVVGLPKCGKCECPSGYCPRNPLPGSTVAFEGGKVQFCCGKCKAIFMMGPEKFASAARHQLVATGQFHQVKCPRCGGELGSGPGVEIAGVTVLFCSDECRAAVAKAAPADQEEMVFGAKAFARGFVAKR